MKIEIINRQKLKRIERGILTHQIADALNFLTLSGRAITLIICDDAYIRRVNRRVFKLTNSTDVISLPINNSCDSEFLGEIIVSVQQAVIQCSRYNNNWKKELLLYIVHGILHLAGYDDTTAVKRKKMFKKQDEVLREVLG